MIQRFRVAMVGKDRKNPYQAILRSSLKALVGAKAVCSRCFCGKLIASLLDGTDIECENE